MSAVAQTKKVVRVVPSIRRWISDEYADEYANEYSDEYAGEYEYADEYTDEYADEYADEYFDEYANADAIRCSAEQLSKNWRRSRRMRNWRPHKIVDVALSDCNDFSLPSLFCLTVKRIQKSRVSL